MFDAVRCARIYVRAVTRTHTRQGAAATAVRNRRTVDVAEFLFNPVGRGDF